MQRQEASNLTMKQAIWTVRAYTYQDLVIRAIAADAAENIQHTQPTQTTQAT